MKWKTDETLFTITAYARQTHTRLYHQHQQQYSISEITASSAHTAGDVWMRCARYGSAGTRTHVRHSLQHDFAMGTWQTDGRTTYSSV